MNKESNILMDKYATRDSYDEMFTSNEEVKPSWKSLSEKLNDLGAEQLASRQVDIDWILSENGVTYNVYNDPQGLNRPWNLNVVPFVLQESEWNRISKGLKQRANLLDLILKDVYGKRELIKNSIIPHEIIYGHRGFLRQCDQIKYKTAKNLSIYASDLSRGPDGRIWVVNDRTQAPSGMGYTLENRATAGRVLSDVYDKINVRKLSQFFNDFNELLITASPKVRENPNIIILTPGPHNETYFEHAYLASSLGYPLVLGKDLVVRDGFLWMKSLNGLKRIDVVLRRVDDAYMDPLELREDSHLGIAGLLDVVRRENVTIINPVGSGVIENSGLMPFMPAIAKYFLNEDLILPQIATWWCGQKKERDFVLENIKDYVIKRIDRSSREHIYFVESLNDEEIVNLKDKLLKKPYLFVAQEKIKFSTVPNFVEGKLEPRNMVCRAFAIAKGNDYTVMPGGLVRVSPELGDFRVSNQRGGTSKDFCVINDLPEGNNTKYNLGQKIKYEASSLKDLPSHTAENLYWAGRYVGRALVTSRYLRMVLKQLANVKDDESALEDPKISVLLKSVTQITGTFPGFVGKGKYKAVTNVRSEITSVIFDPNRYGSLANILKMFNNSYYAIRNLWSSDMWRVFELIQQSWRTLSYEEAKTKNYNEFIKILDKLVTRLIAFMGLIEESIMVNQGLLLYFIGLNLEYGILTIEKSRALLVVSYDENVEYEVLEAFLNSHESLNIYRHSYRSYITIENVMRLLLLDVKYARSLTYIISRTRKDVGKLPYSKSTDELLDYDKHIFEAFSRLRLASVEELASVDEKNKLVRENLKVLLVDLSDLLFKTSQSISDAYFNHTHVQNQMAAQRFPL